MKNLLRVRSFQRAGDLQRRAHGFVRCDGTLNRRTLHILKYQIVRPDVINLADMRMIQRCNGAGFLLKARTMLALELLDGDKPVEACVASFPDLAHTTRPNGREDFVGAEFFAYRKRHL